MNADTDDALLERLQACGIVDAQAREALAAHAAVPWWLAALLAVAAWIAALIILSAFFGPLLMLVDSAWTRGLGGAALVAAALYLFRHAGPFAAQMALAFSLAGQGLIVFAVAGEAGGVRPIAFTAAVVAAAMMRPSAPALHRAVCALIVLASVAWVIGPGSGLALYGVAVTAAAAMLWLTRAHWAGLPTAPLARAAAHAATLVALCLAPYGHAGSAVQALESLAGAGRAAWVPAVYSVGVAAVLLGTVGRLTRAAPIGVRAAAIGGALLLALVAYRTPGLITSAVLLLAVFQACHRSWTALTLAFAALYVAELYYSLHTTLLVKSVALAGTGALLLVARAALLRWSTTWRTG